MMKLCSYNLIHMYMYTQIQVWNVDFVYHLKTSYFISVLPIPHFKFKKPLICDITSPVFNIWY